MAIAEVIKFEGPQDALVWKFPIEDFNATSQLIVDETHEALLVVNGNAADLFTAGRRTLSVPNIPIARTLIEIPTGGNSPFPCKVFFINKVHAMDLLWGTQGPIALEDPLYDIFMHVMANGSMSVSVENSRKFMLKIVGFRDRFTPDDLIAKFRGIISSHVKDCISKIMINGMLSYFMMNAHLFETLFANSTKYIQCYFSQNGGCFVVNTLELANGNFVTMAVAEVTAVPYFELYDKALDRANYMNQVLFTQIISSMHRKSIPNQASFEFLFQSVPVSNQTYKAQVKLYFIVRRIGANRIENEKAVADTMSSIQIDLEEKNYVVEAFDKISDYESFAHSLEKANCSRVLSVSKKEKAVPNAFPSQLRIRFR